MTIEPSEGKPKPKTVLGKAAIGVFTIAVFIAGGVASPFLGKLGEWGASKIVGASDTVQIDACLPLRRARTLIKKQVGKNFVTIADQAVEWMNETSVFINNKTGKTLKDGTLSIYAVSGQEKKADLLFSDISGSSIKGSTAYKVSRHSSAFEISLPLFNDKDFIVVNSNFGVPIAYIVELFGDGFSYKAAFEPGCQVGSYIEAPPTRTFFSYTSDRCIINADNSRTCKLSSEIPFEITKEMRGMQLRVEDQINRD